MIRVPMKFFSPEGVGGGGAAPAGGTTVAPVAGAASASPAASVPAPTGTAPVAGGASTRKFSETMKSYITPAREAALSAEEAAKPATQADVAAHARRLASADRASKWQQSMINGVDAPISFGDGDARVTHAFGDEAEVHSFAGLTRQVLTDGITHEQLRMLHHGPRLVKDAYEKGRADAMKTLEKSRAGVTVQNPGQGEDTPAGEVQIAAADPKTKEGRRGLSIQDRVKALDPKYYESFMKGEEDFTQ